MTREFFRKGKHGYVPQERTVVEGVIYIGQTVKYHWWYAVTPSAANEFAYGCNGIVCNFSGNGCNVKVRKP